MKFTKTTLTIVIGFILTCGLIYAVVGYLANLRQPHTISNVPPVSAQNGSTPEVSTAVTHTWYSSLFFAPYAQPLYVYPGSLNLNDQGIEIGKPKVNFTDKTVFYTHVPDLYLSFPLADKVTGKQVVKAGEWDVTIGLLNQRQQQLLLHLIKGDPTLFITSAETELSLTGSIHDVQVLEPRSAVITTLRGNVYLIQSDKAFEIDAATHSTTFASGSSVRLTILPDELGAFSGLNQSVISAIAQCTADEPAYTDYEIKTAKNSQNDLEVALTFSEHNNQAQYLMNVWPHQLLLDQHILEGKTVLGTYNTARGRLSLICTSNTSMKINALQLPMSWAQAIDPDKAKQQLAKDLFTADLQEMQARVYPAGVYFKGKYIKDYVDLWETATLIGDDATANDLKQQVIKLLMAEIDHFAVNDNTGFVMHDTPEFGSEKGNDHHFQYSYYIYSYARMYPLLSNADQDRVDGLMHDLLREGIPGVTDQRSYSRKSRFFDSAEGHSWADAQALFADGNNQESSSEALFYWYAWYLWGDTSHNQTLKTWSSYYFSSEVAARNSYWFLQNNDLLSSNLPRPILSLIWGGKADYATWFSPDDDKILGIQLLPINPSSTVSLRLQENDFNRIKAFYDHTFAQQTNLSDFAVYYQFFKKFNHDGADTFNEFPGDEYQSRTLYYLIKP